ncbi:hypothetical protein Tco_0389555 [Tanacetum coccineum]
MPDKEKVLSQDPFNLSDILDKRKDSGDDLKYPPGFTPSVTNVEEVKGTTSNEVMDIQEKDKNRSQNDKTEHGNGKSVKQKSKSKTSQQKVKVKVNPEKWI